MNRLADNPELQRLKQLYQEGKLTVGVDASLIKLTVENNRQGSDMRLKDTIERMKGQNK
jgi:hypothetical protein